MQIMPVVYCVSVEIQSVVFPFHLSTIYGYLKLSESEKSKDSLGSSNSPPLPDSFALMTSSGKASATRVLSFQSV